MRFNENFNSISFSILTSLKNLKTGHFFFHLAGKIYSPMRQKEVKTEKREQKTESEKPKRWLRHTPEGYQFTEAEYALNALGNFLTLIACGKIKLSWSDEMQLKRLTKYLVRMLFKRPWRSVRKKILED